MSPKLILRFKDEKDEEKKDFRNKIKRDFVIKNNQNENEDAE